ncbi:MULTISPECIES: GNAT family N-acetyltransferase [Bradyrhizobium]|uniref:GNAT family N-acetyltransferase n=1 Tax=Bradyrhizobium TaxID=374 RepID=UPI000A00579E|nr:MULTISPECIES: GNAT family N-acetyltransferase [Bradyrhizobium]UFW51335.1 N-acetyltransferase family protein [Bradyrhizobium arachidis]
MFRRATQVDAAAMAKIYNQAMKPGVFAISQRTPDTCNERVAWLSAHQDPYPAFVYEDKNGKVIGWCSLSRLSIRPEYADVAETSRYIDENYRGKGIGRRMAAHLIETATNLGFRLLVSNAFERNLPSINSVFGYQRVVVLHEGALVHGEWQDFVFFWKKLR